jgi:hypothetical protein
MSTPPTGLGAVIRATIGEHRGVVLVRTDRILRPWMPDYGSGVTDAELSDIEVLHPGIEVPS